MITKKVPNTWKELQNNTAKILAECGFIVEIEKKCDSARGVIEIDVFAEEKLVGRKNIIIIECKHWKSKIPQTIIHSFRTVVNDIGANTGYIVTKTGYQSGSFNASKYTNIELLTWEQFQEKFEVLWYQKWFAEYVEEHFDPLCTYSEPIVPTWALKLDDNDTKIMKKLRKDYEEIGWVIMYLMKYSQIDNPYWFRKLPLSNFLKTSKIPENIMNESTYRELLKLLHEYCDPGIEAFKKLEEKVVRPT